MKNEIDINSISRAFGISKQKRVNFSIENLGENEMKLSIIDPKSKISQSDLWFGTHQNGYPCVLLPAQLLQTILETIRNLQRQKLELELEKSIWQHIPADFGDVWSVAMNEIQNSKTKKDMNLDKIINKIKKEHPNLFVDMHSIMQNKEI